MKKTANLPDFIHLLILKGYRIGVLPSHLPVNITSSCTCIKKPCTCFRFGWFVSKNSSTPNIIADHRQPLSKDSNTPDIITDHWRSFQHSKVAKIFALTEEEEYNLRANFTVDTTLSTPDKLR